MVQAIATFLFFAVFILLFIALSLYIGITLYGLFRKQKRASKRDSQRTGEHEIGKVNIDGTAHIRISGPLEKTEKES